MASLFISSFIFLLSCLLPVEPKCPTSFDCGYLGKIQFPWTTTERTDCGLFVIQGCHDPNVPKTLLTNNGTRRTFKVFRVTHTVSSSESTIEIRDMDLQERLRNRSCESFSSNYTLPLTLPPPALASFKISNIGFFLRCNRLDPLDRTNASFFNFTCVDSDIIYGFPNPARNKSSSLFSSCSVIQFPIKDIPDDGDPFTFITSMVNLQVRLSDNCSKCLYDRAGRCQLDPNGIFNCDEGGAIGSVSLVIFGLIVILLRNKQRHKSLESKNQSRSIEYHNTHSNATFQGSRNIYFRVPVFSYEELEEATNKFDQSRQLGRGGFGIVYYGKLKDGREVAVKRLFERNYRGAQQLINEVEILKRLRHRNLVSLYGCTSLACHELLLVYEYISNGTLGGHLHGNLSKPGSLPWPVRLRIAIETANALSYLQCCGIIHRDVKSNNLLLDVHFSVKVADFGISRLFPMFASHVSTAPAGTPGYLDPEYYQFCQLTEKSDVYSFGVVLIELISSMPAIFTRATDKINLANMAVKKIQRSAFSELVDPSLGFESDDKVREMIILVAKLAFRCLQRDVELRPSMGEVMEFLQKIENGNYDLKRLEFHGAGFPKREIYTSLPTSVHRDGDASLNNSEPQHPPHTV